MNAPADLQRAADMRDWSGLLPGPVSLTPRYGQELIYAKF
jgi:hypothetical protein